MKTTRNGLSEQGWKWLQQPKTSRPMRPSRRASALLPGWSLLATCSDQVLRLEQAVVGETPNLAARLQNIAEPNKVVIADGTRKLVGNLFELEDLAALNLKGIAGPGYAWAALRASSVESRFDALHATGQTELVGREEELELLLAAVGEGQEWRRPSSTSFRRSRDRKVSTEQWLYWNGLHKRRTRACAISVRRRAPIARSFQ